MKKKILLLISIVFITTLFLSCQDEFCLEPTTPRLIITFYNKDNINQKKQLNLIAQVDKNILTRYNGNNAVDSILIPLDTQNTKVLYNFSILDSLGSETDVLINYTVEDVYVSKSCGFKSVFNNLTIKTTTTDGKWLSRKEVSTTKVINEKQIHVKIFH